MALSPASMPLCRFLLPLLFWMWDSQESSPYSTLSSTWSSPQAPLCNPPEVKVGRQHSFSLSPLSIWASTGLCSPLWGIAFSLLSLNSFWKCWNRGMSLSWFQTHPSLKLVITYKGSWGSHSELQGDVWDIRRCWTMSIPSFYQRYTSVI